MNKGLSLGTHIYDNEENMEIWVLRGKEKLANEK